MSVCFRKRIWSPGVLLLLIHLTTTYKLTNSTLPEETGPTNSRDLPTANSTDLKQTDEQKDQQTNVTYNTENQNKQVQNIDNETKTDVTKDQQNGDNDDKNKKITDDRKTDDIQNKFDKNHTENNTTEQLPDHTNDKDSNLQKENDNNNEPITLEIKTEHATIMKDIKEKIKTQDDKVEIDIEVTTVIDDDFDEVTERMMPIFEDVMNENSERIEHRLNLGVEISVDEEISNVEMREVEDAVDYGLRKMHELVNVKEPELYRKGEIHNKIILVQKAQLFTLSTTV